jgi:hypothetical protein
LIEPWNIQLALYSSIRQWREYAINTLKIDPLPIPEASYGAAVIHEEPDGKAWWGMILNSDCDDCTIVHECSHIVDFIFDQQNLPTGVENTELRAYMIGNLFDSVKENFTWKEKS